MNKEILHTIVSKLGIEGLGEEEQIKLINSLEEEILSKVNIAIIEALNEADQQQLLNLANEGDEKALNQFLESHISNFKSFVASIARTTITDYLASRNK